MPRQSSDERTRALGMLAYGLTGREVARRQPVQQQYRLILAPSAAYTAAATPGGNNQQAATQLLEGCFIIVTCLEGDHSWVRSSALSTTETDLCSASSTFYGPTSGVAVMPRIPYSSDLSPVELHRRMCRRETNRQTGTHPCTTRRV